MYRVRVYTNPPVDKSTANKTEALDMFMGLCSFYTTIEVSLTRIGIREAPERLPGDDSSDGVFLLK